MRILSPKILFLAYFFVQVLAFQSCITHQKSVVLPTGFRTKLSDVNQRKFNYYFLEAQRLKYLEKEDAAFDMFAKCLEIDTTSAAVCYELADFYLKLNDAASAMDCIRKASRLEPENYWYLYSYANLSQSLNLNDEAESALIRLTSKYTDKPELNYALSGLYSQKKEYKKAIATLDKLEKELGLTEEISIEKFRLFFELKDPKHAFAEIQKLVQGFPKDVRYRILLGDMYLQSNELPKALENYLAVKQLDPDNGYLSVSLANYYEKSGDKVKADEQIRAALMNPKTEVEAKNKILSRYLATRLDKPQESENIQALFTALIEMHPQEDSFYQLFANYLVTQKKLSEAKEKMLFAVGLSPTNVELWRQLLNINLQLSDYNGVIDVCTQAIGYFPQASEFYFYKGMGFFLTDNFYNSIASYQDGIKVTDPKNSNLLSDFYGQIGDVYQRLEKKSLSYQAYDSALVYNQNNIVVLNNYAYNLSIEKRELSKAEQMSGKCVAAEPNNSTYLDTYAWIYFVQKKYTLAKFYIEKALKNGGDTNDVVVEHYGDILVQSGNVEDALLQWNRSLELGNKSDVLKKKIESQSYIEEPVK